METQSLALGFMWVDTPGEQGKASAWAWSGRRPQFRGPAVGWVLLGNLLQHLGQAGGAPGIPRAVRRLVRSSFWVLLLTKGRPFSALFPLPAKGRSWRVAVALECRSACYSITIGYNYSVILML